MLSSALDLMISGLCRLVVSFDMQPYNILSPFTKCFNANMGTSGPKQTVEGSPCEWTSCFMLLKLGWTPALWTTRDRNVSVYHNLYEQVNMTLQLILDTHFRKRAQLGNFESKYPQGTHTNCLREFAEWSTTDLPHLHNDIFRTFKKCCKISCVGTFTFFCISRKQCVAKEDKASRDILVTSEP